MKWRFGYAFLLALPIELVNFYKFQFPLDVDYPPNMPWYIQAIDFQWLILHLPGLRSTDWFEKLSGCRQINAVMGCSRVDISVLLVSGYLSTVLLLLIVIYGIRFFIHAAKSRTKPAHAA
jgi:hypothetical protein